VSLQADVEPQHAPPTLEARSLASVFWLTLQNAATAVLLVAIPSVLARVLTPDDIGLLEIALAFFGVATLFMELGTGPAIIQRPALDARFLATVFFVNVATGVLFALALIAARHSVTGWLRMDGHLDEVLWWLGLTLVPLSTAIVPRNLLARRLSYRRIAVADGVAGVTATLAGLSALSRGLHAALVVGFITYGVSVTILLWLNARWRPAAAPRLGDVASLLRFSLSVSGSKMLENLSLRSDQFLIGRYLGAASVGLFGLSRTIVRVPLRYLLNVSDGVLLSGLASLQSDRVSAGRYYLAALRIELAILGPAVVVAAVFAPELSRLLFGPTWDRAALIAQLLAFAAWRNITGHTTGAVLLSHGRPDLQLRWTMYSLLLTVMYFFIGLPWGLEGVVLAGAVLDTAGWAIRHTMANRLLDIGWRSFTRALAPLWLTHLAYALVMIAVRHVIVAAVPGIGARFAVGTVTGLLAYLVVIRLLMPGWLTTLRQGTIDSVAHGLSRHASDAAAG
jgi:PST family polysaccharide transporter